MKSTKFSGISLAFLGTAQAGVIASRQASFDFECNGQQHPDLDDCMGLFETFTDGTKTYTKPSGLNTNVLWFDNGDESNCRVEITWNDASYVVTGNQIAQGVDGVSSTCFPAGTGGSANDIGDRFSIGATRPTIPLLSVLLRH